MSTKVRTACLARKRRTPIGTFLSKTMRNAVALRVSQNRLDMIRGNLKLFGDFSGAQAVVEVVDDRVDRHPRTAQHGSTALDSRLGFDEQAFRPVDFFFCKATAASRPL